MRFLPELIAMQTFCAITFYFVVAISHSRAIGTTSCFGWSNHTDGNIMRLSFFSPSPDFDLEDLDVDNIFDEGNEAEVSESLGEISENLRLIGLYQDKKAKLRDENMAAIDDMLKIMEEGISLASEQSDLSVYYQPPKFERPG